MTEALAIIPRSRRPCGLPAAQLCRTLLHEFLRDKRIRGCERSTLARYQKIGADFFLHLGDLRPDEIRPKDIREYLAWQVSRGIKTHGLQQQLSALRSLFVFAEAMGIVHVSPAREIHQRRYIRNLPKVLTEEQMNALINLQENLRNKAMIETMYATGARVREVARMRVEDVNWSARTIIVDGKGSKERLVPLNSRAVELLKEYLRDRKTGWLFQANGQNDQRGTVRLDSGCWRGDG